ncbi:hypothetical protein [Coleofasciculus chthonoplastes]|uniref:hypothetical protein n=1 Tax=Coleofasciculus chthonoplastes TaxID=64178 RepID=UPI0012F962D7|nr:hypothetical protein [Coleofasciculus chthonoplastes]
MQGSALLKLIAYRPYSKTRDARERTPQADRTPSLSLTLFLLLPSLEIPDELISPQSISSGKSSIDIPPGSSYP